MKRFRVVCFSAVNYCVNDTDRTACDFHFYYHSLRHTEAHGAALSQALILPWPLSVFFLASANISACAIICVFVFSQALQARRAKCEHQDRDPIVWTCHRVMKWIRDIDLKVGGRSVTVFPLLGSFFRADWKQILHMIFWDSFKMPPLKEIQKKNTILHK